ncbi:MAG: Gfo/Idh/MocA family oxidoreductase, partial [Cytophagales bacterium]|nr:Gfo/Idh/MocA family oxidoreductase [Cytophaga sp.]
MVLENSDDDLQMLYGETILFFGGGRWTRILLQVTTHILPNSKIVVISPRNAEGMRKWVSANQAYSRVIVSENADDWLEHDFFAAIVVNAVHDHSNAIQWCIKKSIPILVEKPISLNYNEVLDLYKQALRHNVLLAPSHIFLFTSYLEEFKRKIAAAGYIEKI